MKSTILIFVALIACIAIYHYVPASVIKPFEGYIAFGILAVFVLAGLASVTRLVGKKDISPEFKTERDIE